MNAEGGFAVSGSVITLWNHAITSIIRKMTATFALGLLAEVVSLALLHHRLGRQWLRRPATLTVLVGCVYQGLTSVVLAFPSIGQWDFYRQGIAGQFSSDAALLLSVSLLVFTISYLTTQPQQVLPAAPDRQMLARALDWRLLAAACAPLAVLTYEGRGYNGSMGLGSPGASLGVEFASLSFTVLVPVTAAGFVLRHGARWFLPILAAQSVLLAAAGERTPVLADAVALVVVLMHACIKPPRAQLHAATALTVLGILAITTARSDYGRSVYRTDTGLGTRVSALAGGITALGGSPSPSQQNDSPGLFAQAAIRLEGNSFTAGILQARSMGFPGLSASYIPDSLLELVPSAMWPSKLAHGDALYPGQLEIDDFGLQPVNFLPGLPGLYAGFLPPAWLVLFMAALGCACGYGEKQLLRSASPARIVLLAGAVKGVFSYEAGLPVMLLQLRSAAVIAAAVWALGQIRRATGHSALTGR